MRTTFVITDRCVPLPPPGGHPPFGFSRLARPSQNPAASPVRAPSPSLATGPVARVEARALAARRGRNREGPTGVVPGPARLRPLSRIGSCHLLA